MGIVNLVVSIITCLGVAFGIFTYYSDVRRQRKKETLKAYAEMEEEVFNPLIRWAPQDIRDACEYKEGNGYKELSGYLARIELFSLGLEEKIYDFDTFYSISSGFFDGKKLSTRLYPLIEVKNTNPDKDYFQNLHRVWNKMDQRREKEKRHQT